MVHNQQLILAVNRLPGHNGRPKRQLLEQCRDERDLYDGITAYLRQGRRQGRLVNFKSLLHEAEVEEKQLQRWGIGYALLGEASYPLNLAAISDPPLILYYRGNFNFKGKESCAIVGTRRPTARARREAYKIALEFSLSGYPVVSGLAFGIDRSAHIGALDGGGVTWAVLAGGLDRPSPYSHRPLASRILENNGALIAEMPPGQFPAKYAFPRRNRILSGLCKGCLIVQAPAKSGALITADFALDQNRDLYVASSGLYGPNSEGTENLEQQGAPIVQNAMDILNDWGFLPVTRPMRSLPAADCRDNLVLRMKLELNGTMYRHAGGCFEYCGA